MTADILHPVVVDCLQRYGIEHKVFACDADFADTALFCTKYDYPLEQAANAIIVAGKGATQSSGGGDKQSSGQGDKPSSGQAGPFACCLVLAVTRLDVNKKVCQLLGVKKASFAAAEQTIALTGMQIGGVTPFGLGQMPLYIDSAVMEKPEVVVGGGNRMSKVLLAPQQLLKLPGAEVVSGLGQMRAAQT